MSCLYKLFAFNLYSFLLCLTINDFSEVSKCVCNDVSQSLLSVRMMVFHPTGSERYCPACLPIH